MSATPRPDAHRSAAHAFVVAYCFPPHAAVGTMRTLRLVRRLAQDGWKVTVLTASPDVYLDGTPVDRALLERVPAGVQVIRTRAVRPLVFATRVAAPFRRKRQVDVPPPSGRHNEAEQKASGRLRKAKALFDQWTAFPDDEVGWIAPAIVRGLVAAIRHRPSVIYSSAPPWSGQVIAYVLASLLKCRWVADFRDPWARGPWREGRLAVVRRATARLESLVMTRADVVLFTTYAARDEVAAFYGPAVASKLRVVRNGCDASEFPGAAARPRGDSFVLLHTGSLYGARNPLPLIRALAEAVGTGAIDRARFRLRLIGPVALAGVDLSRSVRELGVSDMVDLIPRVSRREAVGAMADASALLLIQPGHPLSVPAKTYEYLAAGRPLLAMTEENETAELVRASGCGIVAAPHDVTALREALLELMRTEHRAPVVVPRDLFDGEARAIEMASVLRVVCSEPPDAVDHLRPHADAGVRQPRAVPAGEVLHE